MILISNGLHMGLSLADLNEFRVKDFVELTDIYTGEVKNRPRQADQDDIDIFFG